MNIFNQIMNIRNQIMKDILELLEGFVLWTLSYQLIQVLLHTVYWS